MKAILVIDTPKTCKECKCELCWVCVQMFQHIDEYIDPSKAKPDWCPLRPLPQRKERQWYGNDAYKDGWNDCLKEIEE